MGEFDQIDVEIGRRLRERRLAAGMTQADLGNRLGLTFQQIQKYEGGRSRMAVSTLLHACEALQIRFSVFVGGLTGGDPAALDDLSPRERDLVDGFRRIGEAERDAVAALLKAMASDVGLPRR